MGVSTHIQEASKHRDGQTYRGVSKHMGHPNIQEGIQTWGYPNIQGVIKTYGASKHTGGAFKYMGGIQTYRRVSKDMGVSKHKGGIQAYRGYIQIYRGIQTYWGCPNICRHPNIQEGVETWRASKHAGGIQT